MIILVVVAFALDFAHGLVLRQNEILFHPVYRVRQSLAIALSRLHEVPVPGYTAHRGVVDALNKHGFGIFPNDAGRDIGWEKLFDDPAALNRAFREAATAPVDTSAPLEILRGNELGYADFIWTAFELFGIRVQSLYLLLFLLLGASAASYVAHFRRAPLMLFLLVLYLAAIYWLQLYVKSEGVGLNAITNSRVFSALTLLPAFHILVALALPRPMDGTQKASIVVQCVIFTFLMACRDETRWQLAMILVAAGLIAANTMLRSWRADRRLLLYAVFKRCWPAILLGVLVAGISVQKRIVASELYAGETKAHVFWHTVLAGLLVYSPELRTSYLDRDEQNADMMVYLAVTHDLNKRSDTSSPIARVENGRIVLDSVYQTHYERLVRSLTLRILVRHPIEVSRGIATKIGRQFVALFWRPAIDYRDMAVPIFIAALGAAVCGLGGGLSHTGPAARRAISIPACVLLFALVTPAIFPANEAVGTAVAYLTAGALLVMLAIAALVKAAAGKSQANRYEPSRE